MSHVDVSAVSETAAPCAVDASLLVLDDGPVVLDAALPYEWLRADLGLAQAALDEGDLDEAARVAGDARDALTRLGEPLRKLRGDAFVDGLDACLVEVLDQTGADSGALRY